MNLWGIGAIIVALGLLIFGVNKWESRIEQRGYDKAAAIYAVAALKDEETQRAEEKRRATEQGKAQDADREAAKTAVADNARLDDANRGLRQQLAAERAGRTASSDPAIARERAATDALGDVYANCTERYSLMGKEAQASRNAGQLCERFYDSLNSPIRDKVIALRSLPTP